jgi:prepilin-type processing-associated H-X9-DG protein
MTVIEVLVVVIVSIVFVAFMFLPLLVRPKIHGGPNCVTNLRQINIAFQIWEGDNNNQYPMSVSVTNGGGMELIQAGNLAGCLQLVSNELSTTKILICPADHARTFATNWNDLGSSHISYFFGMDISNENNPNLILDGDDNLIVGGPPVKSGIGELSPNSPASWSDARHRHVGNIGMADGSVREVSSIGLQQAIQQTGLAKNRIVIP